MIDNETAMVRAAVRVGVVLGVPATVVAGLVRGPLAAATAAGCILLVVGGFGLTGLALRWAARRGPTTVQGVALGGTLTRLWLYGILFVTLSPTDLVDRPTLALTAPLAMIVLLAVEVRLVTTHREFWMIHPTPLGSEPKDRP